MDEITPNLFLGDILSTYNGEKLQEKGAKHVISLIDQPLPQWLRTKYVQEEVGIRRTEFFVHDDEIEDILAVMTQACDLVHKSLEAKNEGVLVHCGLGVSRSGSVVIGYLMRRDGIDRDAALALVKEKRPSVCPNTGFWEQLKIWEECGYEIWEEVDGKRIEKGVYKTWKESAEEKMRARVAAGARTWRDAGVKKVELRKTAGIRSGGVKE